MFLSSRLNARNGRNGESGRAQTNLHSKVIQGIAGGVGLVSESIHHNKEKKGSNQTREDTPVELEASTPIEALRVDEAAWELNEAQDLAFSPSIYSSESELEHSGDPRSFLLNHPSPIEPSPSGAPSALPRLTMPVVLTQRRPKDRKRGFIRAYAPALNDVGIDEATFLDFVDQLNKAVEPSPWLNAINLAGLVGLAVPAPFTFIISAAVAIATQVAIQVHSRSKTNSFLDHLNDEFFRPRGLICLIMTWRPQDEANVLTPVDFEGGVAVAAEAQNSKKGAFGKIKHNLQSSSGSDVLDWPETAPLIFPALDKIANSDSEKEKNAIKRGKEFVAEYMDRRAQAKWSEENPDDQMANLAPKPTFRSRWADPKHPASSGDTLALLTGGHLQKSKLLSYGKVGGAGILKSEVGASILQSTMEESKNYGSAVNTLASKASSSPQGQSSQQFAATAGSVLTGVSRGLHRDVLYLMVVNLPSEQEIAETMRILYGERPPSYRSGASP